MFIEGLLPAVAKDYESPVFRTWPGWTKTNMFLHPFRFGFLFAFAHAIVSEESGVKRFLSVWGGAAFGLLLAVAGPCCLRDRFRIGAIDCLQCRILVSVR